jgi:hypothetical protein
LASTELAEAPTENNTPVTIDTTVSSENLTPLQAVQTGAYSCFHTLDNTYWVSSDDPSYYEDDDPDIFALFIFPDGTSLAAGANDKVHIALMQQRVKSLFRAVI